MFNSGSDSLKFYKRLKVYKNSTGTVEFDVNEMTGRSYRWQFCAKVNGVMVFNNYSWSPTTNNHQWAVRSVLNDLKIKYVVVDAGRDEPRSFSKHTMRSMFRALCDLQIEIDTCKRPDTHAQGYRIRRAKEIQKDIETLEGISKDLRLSQKDKKQISQQAVDKYFEDLHENESDKCFKVLSLKRAASEVEAVEL